MVLQTNALGVASSGIAAFLLVGGQTAHSVFKLPLNLNYDDHPLCNIKKGTVNTRMFKEIVFIVWDERTMFLDNNLLLSLIHI